MSLDLGSIGLTFATTFRRRAMSQPERCVACPATRVSRSHSATYAVNPNFGAHARAEIVRCLDAGMIGINCGEPPGR